MMQNCPPPPPHTHTHTPPSHPPPHPPQKNPSQYQDFLKNTSQTWSHKWQDLSMIIAIPTTCKPNSNFALDTISELSRQFQNWCLF